MYNGPANDQNDPCFSRLSCIVTDEILVGYVHRAPMLVYVEYINATNTVQMLLLVMSAWFTQLAMVGTACTNISGAESFDLWSDCLRSPQ